MTVIAIGQMCSSSNLLNNGIVASRLAKEAAQKGAHMLFLPEASDYIASNAAHSKSLVQPVTRSPFLLELRSTLRDLNAAGTPLEVLVGVHEPSENMVEDPRTKNTLLHLNNNGEIVHRYQKLHLFDVDIKNGPILKESNSVQPGSKIQPPFPTPAGILGVGICYDMRFPELSLKLRSQGAQLLTFPSAWTMKTGPHFHALGRATAIFTQCYVVLPAQEGEHITDAETTTTTTTSNTTLDENVNGNPDSNVTAHQRTVLQKRESYGHSAVFDPLGNLVTEIRHGEGIALAEIDLRLVETTRENMPLITHRRRDIFGDV